jgi:hypothetical protein
MPVLEICARKISDIEVHYCSCISLNIYVAQNLSNKSLIPCQALYFTSCYVWHVVFDKIINQFDFSIMYNAGDCI